MPRDLETDGRGNIHVKGAPHRSISTKDVAIAAQFKQGKTISGRGIFLVPLSGCRSRNRRNVAGDLLRARLHGRRGRGRRRDRRSAMVRMDSAYELGRALNPRLVEQQLVGGAWMGMSHALFETTEPYYPDPQHGPRDFVEYLMPGPGDICPHDIAVLERPAADGPFGAKGPGEMCANPVLPAVANAIFNAVGVRVDDLPITPEKVLRAIKAQGGARPQARAISCMAARGNIVGIDSPEALEHALRAAYYLADDGYCDGSLSRARAGQAAAARRRARASARPRPRRRSPRCWPPAIRLQCYEGIDASAALYEWNYPRQMLAIRQAGRPDHRHLRREFPDRASDARRPSRAPI